MCPLTSHFRVDALTTLETVLKQTKEARGFRRAQGLCRKSPKTGKLRLASH